MKKPWKIRFINLWPPLLGAGIKVDKVSDDLLTYDVSMKLRFWNKNYFGTHYGGSLFSMTDPFYALILIAGLGKDYVVWDKSAHINFKKPGKGKLTAHFNITRERIEEIRRETDANEKMYPTFKLNIVDEAGDVVAEVERTLYVRRKDTMSLYKNRDGKNAP